MFVLEIEMQQALEIQLVRLTSAWGMELIETKVKMMLVVQAWSSDACITRKREFRRKKFLRR
jgi:hypothetical protein